MSDEISVTKLLCGSQAASRDHQYLVVSAQECDTVVYFVLMREKQIVNAHYNQTLTYAAIETVWRYLGKVVFLEARDLSKYRVKE